MVPGPTTRLALSVLAGLLAVGMIQPLSTTPDAIFQGGRVGANFGWSVAGAGDVDGNGYDDLVVGAHHYSDGQTYEGRAFLFLGGPGGLAPSAWTFSGNQDNAQAGYSVAGAGDVNGDGYDDVIIGAPGHSNPTQGEGRACVFHGGPSGLPATPAWTAESNESGAALGTAVSSAGDVNGDGYDDVIVGIPNGGFDDEGGVQVHLGGASGLATTPAWTAAGDVDSSKFGASVAAAGDLNNDGYDDVIVGAWRGGSTDGIPGSAHVFMGSAGGLSAAATWSMIGFDPGAEFGCSVAGNGDLNGDGYDDIVVGAPGMDRDGLEWFEYGFYSDTHGAAYAWFGGPGGPSAQPDWTTDLSDAAAGDRIGRSVAIVGDVNGDGCSDVVVAAHQVGLSSGTPYGAAYLYEGSEFGVSPEPAVRLDGLQPYSVFAASVAGAGDVDGDGLDDLAVGACRASLPESDEGAVYVYRGRPPSAVISNLSQTRIDGVTSIDLGGEAAGGGFIASATLGDSAPGGLELLVEVKPAGLPFDGRNILSGPSPLRVTTGLALGEGYHWRARTRNLATSGLSHWSCFGANPDQPSQVDFQVSDNPPDLAAPIQRGPGSAGAEPAGARFELGTLRFIALLGDPDTNRVRMEIEVQPVGRPFLGEATLSSDLVDDGAVASVSASFPQGAYRWQYRCLDELGLATAWTSFGGNGEDERDFLVLGGSTNPSAACGLAAAPGARPGLAWLLVAVVIPLLFLRDRRGAAYIRKAVTTARGGTMTLLTRAFRLALPVLLLAGCGDDSGGSAPPAPPVLLQIRITPSDVVLAPEEQQILSVLGLYDDGTEAAVTAGWSSAPAGVVLDASGGSSVTATAVSPAICTVTATKGDLEAEATIIVVAPPPRIYANSVGGISRIPEDGGALIPVYGSSPYHKGYGMVVDATETWLYTIGTTGSGNQLFRVDLTGPLPQPQGPGDVVADLSSLPNPRSLEVDLLGRVLVTDQGGALLRYDPATGDVETIPVVWSTLSGNAEVDSKGQVMHCPLLVNDGTWISRRTHYVFGEFEVFQEEPWATLPSGMYPPFVASGLAVNAADEAFIMNSVDTTIYKYADLGDEDTKALSKAEGEETIFALLPGAWGDGDSFGIDTIPGGIVLNRKQWTYDVPADDPRLGIWKAVDLNGDGDSLDAGELVRHHPTWIFNGYDQGCLGVAGR